eukprot:2265418-Rhodomonas_salina.1
MFKNTATWKPLPRRTLQNRCCHYWSPRVKQSSSGDLWISNMGKGTGAWICSGTEHELGCVAAAQKKDVVSEVDRHRCDECNFDICSLCLAEYLTERGAVPTARGALKNQDPGPIDGDVGRDGEALDLLENVHSDESDSDNENEDGGGALMPTAEKLLLVELRVAAKKLKDVKKSSSAQQQMRPDEVKAQMMEKFGEQLQSLTATLAEESSTTVNDKKSNVAETQLKEMAKIARDQWEKPSDVSNQQGAGANSSVPASPQGPISIARTDSVQRGASIPMTRTGSVQLGAGEPPGSTMAPPMEQSSDLTSHKSALDAQRQFRIMGMLLLKAAGKQENDTEKLKLFMDQVKAMELWSAEQIVEEYEKIKELKDLAKTPFMIQIVVQILPSLKKLGASMTGVNKELILRLDEEAQYALTHSMRHLQLVLQDDDLHELQHVMDLAEAAVIDGPEDSDLRTQGTMLQKRIQRALAAVVKISIPKKSEDFRFTRRELQQQLTRALQRRH